MKVCARVKLYDLLNETVHGAVAGGIRRAIKHEEDPPDDGMLDRIEETVHNYVMTSLCEILDFDETDRYAELAERVARLEAAQR